VVRLVRNTDYIRLSAADRVAQLANLSFDAATFEIWGALLNGAALVGVPRDVVLSPRDLAAFLVERRISALFLTTALFNQVAQQAPEAFGLLRHVLFGGEAVDPGAVRRVLRAGPPARLLHVYGPTENTTFSSWFLVTEVAEGAVTVPIGRPIANTRAYVLDAQLQPVPLGVVGELCLGGDGLAREYLNAPELTRERFVESPCLPGERLYRTGDRVRFLPDGNIEFRGRGDQQVKLRGFRIEPAEIEQALAEHPGVAEAAVVLREDLPTGRGFVAYAVAEPGAGLSGAVLRDALKAKLPDYMVPAHVVLLDVLPLTPNGKVDRRALPAPEAGDSPRDGYVPPRTELERRLCEIWEELLGVERVGIEDGFFDLGGHSLLATRVVSRVRSALGRELPLRALFEHPTIGGLCERLPELSGGWVLPPIEVVAERERLPLSYAQQRLWFIDRLEGGTSQYNIAGAARVRGELDRDTLAAALRTIIQRHESLRTVFREDGGAVHQVIRDEVDVRLAVRDLSGLGAGEREREVERLAREDARRPFDLSRDLLLRVELLKLSGAEHVVLFNMHHIASDGWSMGVLMRELGTLYAAYRAGEESPLPPLRVQYADYAQWQRQWLQGEVLEDQLSYWRRQLTGLPAVHSLPLDRPRPAQQGFEGGEHAQWIAGRQRDGIAAVCRESGATLFMVLQAAFAVLLSRYSQETDVAVGSPIAGRVHRDLEPLIGFFVNTLVLRSDLSPDPRFTELLESSKQRILEAYANQHVPFEMLVEELKPGRSLSHSPLFQILFVLQNTERGELELGGSRLEPVGGASGIMKFDLEVYAQELDEGLELSWWYKKELFDGGTIARMVSSFAVLVESLLERPQERVQTLPLLTEAERRQLSAWNVREMPYPRDRRIHELFEAQVERSPEAVAVVLEEERLTYAELNQRANRLAHALIAQSVGTETLVGLCAERSLEMVAGILGILKAGGAYVPLDPEYPEARLRSMVEDSGVEVVLAQRRLSGLECFAGCRTLPLDDPALTAEPAGGNPGLRGRSSDLAYVIYTSGSTGQPKGAMVEHRSVARLVIHPDFLPLDAETVMLQASSVSFDAATLEIWGALLNGGRLVLYPERVPEIGRLNAEIERRGVNTAWLTAGLFEQWSHQLPQTTRLQWVLSGGDVVDPSAVARVYAAFPGIEVINGYGPTENTTFTSCYSIPRDLDPRHALPLGRPINGTGVYVLQENRTLAALGAVGELCAFGDGVARGYLNRPDLTAERFIADPVPEVAGSRLYRTGDLARWRVDGTLEFLGRRDHQVKIRGFRVELGEIEAQLRSEPSVRDALVVAREDRPGDKRLVAYVVGQDGRAPEEAATLLRHLAARLPEHMVPAFFVALEWLPLTANGKVDRGALPAPDLGDLQCDAYVAPRTDVERRLCAIWEELLGLERVGIEESFFDLGGHSLLATQVVSRVRSVLGREIPLRALFEHPTIAGLCERLPELGEGWGLPEISVLAERMELPLSFAQQRLWFIDRLEGGSSHYNIPSATRVRGDLDPVALRRALRTIVERHESLRTVFREVRGEPRQVIRDNVDLRLEARDLSGLDAEEKEREVRRQTLEDARRPFDLGRDLMLRVGLLRLSDEEHVVLLNMHHIASDGLSMFVLIRELGTLYAAYRAGEENPLPPLSVQYADYACWQRQWLRGEVLEAQLSYWRDQLAGLPPVHGLPLDRPRPERQGFDGRVHAQRLDRELSDRIAARCRESGVTRFMLLQAAFSALLSRYGTETDVVVGSPIAGRVHRDVEPLIGFFVNTLVLRSDLSRHSGFAELLESSKQMILDAYAHQHVPFEMLVEELRPERSLSHSPLFQILIVLQNAEQAAEGLGDARLEAEGEGSGIVKFDLELNMLELADGLSLSWFYKNKLFDARTIERMAASFGVLLENLLERPQERVDELPLLPEAERRELLSAWTGRDTLYPRDLRIDELFEAQAERSPEAVAVVLENRRLTYRKLNDRSSHLAQYLIGQGVGAETLVGLCMDRSLEMLVGILGILKAGGAYVPLDPEYPEARLAYMLRDAAADVVLTQSRLAGLGCFTGYRTVALDDPKFAASLAETSGGNLEPRGATGLAYMIYTSGSTGQPKGVMVEHRSVVRLVIHSDYVPLTTETVMLQASSVSFDAATLEIWGALLNGGRLVLYPERVPEIGRLNAQIERHGVNTMWLTAGLFEQWSYQVPRASRLRWVLTGGDVVDPFAVARVYAALADVEVIDGYGPTENTTFTSCYPIPRGFDPHHPVPLGRPIHGTGVYVLQAGSTLAARGAVGELCALGDGVARGYLNRPELTAERFVPDPYAEAPGSRLYRTGDLVRWRSDGLLEFLGRLDGQVKIRGFRVEVGEIEAQLHAQESVREAVVVAREDRPGEKRLVAYVVGREGRAPKVGKLREHVASKLPEHMVPSIFVVLEALPLTENGKVDRAALPAPQEGDYQRAGYAAPRTELERRLCEIWAEVLGVERVGIEDSFFDLGGHSLLATRVVSRVRSALGRELPLRALFEHPTIGGLCERLPELSGGWILPDIEIAAEREDLPLSYAQQRLWFIDRLEGASSQYNIPGAVRMHGGLEKAAFARALRTVVERHESLRTTFREMRGEAVQVIRADVEIHVQESDLSGLGAEEKEREVRRLALDDARRPFDLSRDLLLRVTLLTLAAEEHVVLFNMHHIASDGWSMDVLMRELRTLYAAYRAGQENPLPPLRVQYADYAQWQRQWLRGEVLESQLAYWRRQLAGLPPVHGLPIDRPRPARQGFEGSHWLQNVGGELRERIAVECRESGVTLFMFLQAAFSVLLSRYSQETDVVMGSPIAGRVHRDLEPLIGFFVNTLVLRSDLSGNPRFADLLGASQQATLDAYAHQHVPFEMLVEELKPERSLSHSPLFQVLLVLQNTARGEEGLGDARFEPVAQDIGVVKFDLELNVEELPEGLHLRWLYKRELFNAETIERMAASFGELLESILSWPDERILSLPLLTSPERLLLLSVAHGDDMPYPRDLCLHELFEAQVERSPDALAVVSEDGSLTYRELNERSNRLAHALIARGVGAETLVGLCVERSLDILVGILGTLKAGAAYVPLDPESPEARLGYLLEDSGVEVVLTQSQLAELGCFAGRRTLSLDQPGFAHGNPPRRGSGPGHLAYVIYTSGSTGQPKGVLVEHRSLINLTFGLRRMLAATGLEPGYRWAWNVPVVFDGSVKGLTQLALGVELHVLAQPVRQSPGALLAYVRSQGIDLLDCTPSLLELLLAEAEREQVGLPHLLIGGEAINGPLWTRVCAHLRSHGTSALNVYGPTECTVDSTGTALEGAVDPHIGRPLPNVEAYVLSSELELVPHGGVGELHIGGAGVARGYLRRPALTAERFTANPYGPAAGSRLYRTGDRARWRGDGTLESLGRLDDQVKVRGFRIELGEIEAQIQAQAWVRDAVVVARPDAFGTKRLVAYVVPSGDPSEAGALKSALQRLLPDYMIPAVFVVLEALPLTANGKVDRRALPVPEEGDYQRGGYVAPRTELERRLCEIWQEVLGVERVGIEDSFFDLGGHSLLATRVVSRVRSDLGRELPLRDLFENPTVAGLCERLPQLGGGWVLPEIEVVAERQNLPLSYAQQRLWFIDRLEGGSSHYNLPGAVSVRGDLDRGAFALALQTIVERHESLRTVFREVDGEVVQVIRQGIEFHLEERDLSRLGADEREREAWRLVREDARKPFDLSCDLLLRAGLLKLADGEHVVSFNMHHIASDGWSMGILMRELGILYEAYRKGEENPLPPLSVQYADYACWQRRWLQGEILEAELGYWRSQLAGLPLVHGLPLDQPRPARQGFVGGEQVQRLDRAVRDRITARCRESGVTSFMLLQSAFAVLLSRFSQEPDVVVGSPIAGRVHRDLEPLIGFFVNTLVLRSELSGDPSFAELLERSRRTILDAYAHQHVPFEMLVEELRPERSLSHSPLFQVLFALQNVDPAGALGEPGREAVGGSRGIVKFDLELSARELEDGLVLTWLYKKELFDGTTIARMASSFGVLLAGLLASPEEGVRELPLLTAAEREQMLVEWNDAAGAEDGVPFHRQFEAWAAVAPTSPALWFEGAEMTYGDLNRRANQLARFLGRLGIGRGVPVALCMERSVEVAVGLLAILKAGGVYVPLDPSYPDDRLAWMRADSQSAVLLSLAGQASGLRDLVPTVDLDAEWSEIAREPGDNLDGGICGDDLAYVIYTSGSTGRPKGVAIPHRGLSNLVAAQRDAFRVSPDSRVLQFASLSFDASVFDCTMALANGACLCLAVREELMPGSGLVEVMRRSAVTHATLSPSALAVLEPADLPALATLVVAGEACAAELVALWSPGRRFFNCYGPTEATVWGTYQECRPGTDKPSIGRSILNASAYVLDPGLWPLPAGVPGELYLGGPGVGRGYVGRPDLTAERFLPDPFSGKPGARLYRSGDLVRWLAGGALDFLGRLDHQVKIRGFRIELGEVEASLAAYPGVQDAVVLAREDQPGDKRLVAYVVGRVEAAGLSEHLRGRLPEYMVPSGFVVLEALPLTANGKVDRRALPAPEGKNYQRSEHVAPETELERRLCEIWAEVLGVESVGVEDSFFDLGGHSLLVIKLVSRIHAQLGIRLSPRRLFESSTVRRLAAVLEGPATEAPGAWEPLVALSGDADLPRLFCLPGAGMFSVAMAPLARALAGKMELNVLEARGLDGISPPQTSLDEIVESYGSAVQRRQAQGPYHLLGHSFGGCIAFELARWLEARGDSVSVILLDSFFDSWSAGDAKMLPMQTDLPESEEEPPGFREVFLSQLELQRQYRPSGRVNAPLTLLYAEDGAMAGNRLPEVLERYARVAEQPVRYSAVHGGHHSMLSEANAAQLAERLLALIEQPAAAEVS